MAALERTNQRAPRFLDAAMSLPRAFGFIAGKPRLWPAAALPASIVLVVSAILIWLAFAELGPWLSRALMPDTSSWYAPSASVALRWLSSALGAYAACLFAIFLAPTLSAPALEHLVRARERELGAPEPPPQPLWVEFRAGLSAQVWAFALAAPAFFTLWVLGLVVPVLLPLVVALQVVLIALTVAWNLLDYPLSLRGLSARARLRLLRGHPGAVFGFGLCFAAVSWIPLAGVVLLPIGVVAATQLVHRMLPSPATPGLGSQ